jgi:hypothetical protein
VEKGGERLSPVGVRITQLFAWAPGRVEKKSSGGAKVACRSYLKDLEWVKLS